MDMTAAMTVVAAAAVLVQWMRANGILGKLETPLRLTNIIPAIIAGNVAVHTWSMIWRLTTAHVDNSTC